ncbi:hypothetical protein XELAEV_18004849mg [Xenopus laevis]|uniref:Protein kinase domain-containing protein n=1 Tax=Xenopus laevis TaxID=8355 RepID=A0A974DY09_XENLA|nr:hypothetical protein XELAEV_18004849mg [Xenopus laevis]
MTQGKDFLFHAEELTNEERIGNPIATSSNESEIPIETPVLELTEWSDEEEAENPTATSTDMSEGPCVSNILVKEAVGSPDTSTSPECPEDSSDEEQNAVAQTSHLNWSDEEETEDPDEEPKRLSLLSLLSWPSEEETEDLDKEADRLSLLSLLSWPSEEETEDPDEEPKRLSLLSLLSWPSEEETEDPDEEPERLSLLSLLSWPSEEPDRLSLLSLLSWPDEDDEEIADLAERFNLLTLLDSSSESSEEYLSSGSSDVEPPMTVEVDVKPKLTQVEPPESTEPESSESEEEESSEEYLSSGSSDVEPPMTIKVEVRPKLTQVEPPESREPESSESEEEVSSHGKKSNGSSFKDPSLPSGSQRKSVTFQLPERNKTSSDSSERVYCLEQALHTLANVTDQIQDPTCPGNQRAMVRGRTPSISKSSREDFDLLSVLGEGHFGKVFLAKHKYTKKKVAIKAISKETSDPKAAEDIKREKQIMQLVKRKKAPFLLGLITSFETNCNECLVMDFATGGDLFSLINKYDLPMECIRFYAACIVLGLKFLHEHGIVHRDLKPGNILLDKRGYPQISDYGLSITGKGFRDKLYDICGTDVYMAPELLTDTCYTRSVDWWALGVIIYEMIFAQWPFYGDDSDEIQLTIIYEMPKYPLTMPAHVRDILQGLLTKTPELRLGSTVAGAQAVMERPFFFGMDWEALRRKRIKPMFIVPYTGGVSERPSKWEL